MDDFIGDLGARSEELLDSGALSCPARAMKQWAQSSRVVPVL